jgi:hypothetical protein
MQQTVVEQNADAYDAGDAALLLASLDDNALTVLTNNTAAGPGLDVGWVAQWDLNVFADNSISIGIDKHFTPEPASVALLAIGSLLLIRRR